MAIKDFFCFRKEEYEARIRDEKKYTDGRIHEKLAFETRQTYDGCWSIGKGIVCCIPTGGLSVGTALYGLRRKSVSKRKLQLLEKEAERRGMKKYEERKRDFWIFCASNSVGGCIGCGINCCLSDRRLTKAAVRSARGVVQKTDNPKEGVVENTHGLENHASEIHTAVHPVSDVQSSVPLPASVPSCVGGEAAV